MTGQKGQHILNETYDSDFPDVTSKFGNGLPAKGSLEASAVASTSDGGFIVGTQVYPRHHSYGFAYVFKSNSKGELEWKTQLA